MNRKKIISRAVILLMVLCLTPALRGTAKTQTLKEASFCTVVIPQGYRSGSEPGIFISEHNPLDASNITYTVTEVQDETQGMTNAEKATGQSEIQADTQSSQILTKDTFQRQMKESSKNAYGEDAAYKVTAFTDITIDSYPGYRIEGICQIGSQEIQQTVYLIMASNKTFTITYSQAPDDGHEEDFAQSQASIAVHS